MPEAWLSGPVDGVPEGLQPAAHSLVDALEDMEGAASALTVEQIWSRPGGAPSVAFHLRHVCGSIDRLLTYARGANLTQEQLAAIPLETEPPQHPGTATELLGDLRVAVTHALDVYRAVPPDTLGQPRKVGRAGLPSTVQGLLFHAAEHARRHAGQVVATASIIQGLALAEAELEARANAVRDACVEAALRAYEDAGIRGLCAEGCREVALGVARLVSTSSAHERAHQVRHGEADVVADGVSQ